MSASGELQPLKLKLKPPITPLFSGNFLSELKIKNINAKKENIYFFFELPVEQDTIAYKIMLNTADNFVLIKMFNFCVWVISKSRKENPQELTQLSSRSHPRHLVGKEQWEKEQHKKDTIIDITSDSQVNSNFPYRWSPASLTFNNYFYLFLYLYIT